MFTFFSLVDDNFVEEYDFPLPVAAQSSCIFGLFFLFAILEKKHMKIITR